jgi:hypothetical protein
MQQGTQRINQGDYHPIKNPQERSSHHVKEISERFSNRNGGHHSIRCSIKVWGLGEEAYLSHLVKIQGICLGLKVVSECTYMPRGRVYQIRSIPHIIKLEELAAL